MPKESITYLLLLLLAIYCSEAIEYFVSLNGDDSNSGTISSPLRHVQKAVELLKPGDVCTIREGTYSDKVSISGLQGSPESPITFRAYPGENVVFDGTIPLTLKWTKYQGDIYVAEGIKQDIWQLFVDGDMQVNARWPNAFWNDFSVFDYTRWGFSDATSTYDPTTASGVMVDNGTQNLAGSGLNATDAMAILNIGSWLTWAGRVVKHKPGKSSFDYVTAIPKGTNVHFGPENSRYFLEDKLEFLDAPTEWYYDKNKALLYLWMESSDSPENHQLRGKVSTYAITVTGGSSWLVFSGLNFFATTVFMKGETPKEDVHNITLDSLHFSYPSYSKRMLGSLAVPNTTTLYHNGVLTEFAGNFTIFNCTFEYADGQTIDYRGADGLIQNNLWHHNDFTCVGRGTLFYSNGIRGRFVRNTIHSNGPSVAIHVGAGGPRDRELGLPSGDLVLLNLFYDLKYLQDDGAFVQTVVNAQKDVILEYNWGYDTLKWGLRFDCGTCNVSEDSWGHNGTMRYNVIWRTRGLSVKGDYQFIHNNLVYDSHLYADLFLRSDPGSGDGFKGENAHTIATANFLQHGACSDRATTKCPYPVPGKYSNNAEGDARQLFRDPDNLDFRPTLTSGLIQKGIGPYKSYFGQTYWIPGRQMLSASMPIPPNGTVTAKCDTNLMWLTGYQAESHNVYFGADHTSVERRNQSVSLVGQYRGLDNVAIVDEMKPSVTYYWAVDAVRGSSVYSSDVWQFMCKN